MRIYRLVLEKFDVVDMGNHLMTRVKACPNLYCEVHYEEIYGKGVVEDVLDHLFDRVLKDAKARDIDDGGDLDV